MVLIGPKNGLFFVDDVLVYTFQPEVKDANIGLLINHFIPVKLAIGGNFGGHEVDDSIFPHLY
jgi:hypothetical protein